jgi:hypothetical protein
MESLADQVRLMANGGRLLRATVVSVVGEEVTALVDGERPVLCQMLHTGPVATVLAARDEALVWVPQSKQERPVVLGRLGVSHRETRPTGGEPERLVLCATESVALRCGDASIELRKDGKLLIKGQDVLTRAKRTNRIKGGSVAIN